MKRELDNDYEVLRTNKLDQINVLTGAMDIIDVIANLPDEENTFYVGLTQSDVAYYFRYGGHPLFATPHSHRRNVVALARVLPEYLHIYSNLRSPQDSWENESYEMHARRWRRLHMGALGSGTLITSVNVLPLLGEPPLAVVGQDSTRRRESFWVVRDLGSRGEELWGGTLVSGAPTDEIEKRFAGGRGTLVSLTPPQARHLAHTFSEFYRTNSLTYPIGDGEVRTVLAIEIPALLVANRKLPKPVAESIGRFFKTFDGTGEGSLAGYGYLRNLAETSPDEQRPDFITNEFIRRLTDAISQYRDERGGDLILPRHRSVTPLRSPHVYWELGLAMFFFLLLVFFVSRVLREFRKKGLMETSPFVTIPLAISVSLFWLHLCLLVVALLEYDHYMQYRTDTISPFVEHSYLDLLPMLIHYVASAFSVDNMFPVNRTAQLFWLSIPLIIGVSAFVGVVHIVIPPCMRYLLVHMKGDTIMRLQNHVVICNWHEHVPDVVRQLHSQARLQEREPETVIIITPDPSKIELARIGTENDKVVGEHFVFAIADEMADTGKNASRLTPVFAVQGDPREGASLSQVRVDQSWAVIIFPDNALEEPDSPTTITVLNVEKLIKKRTGASSGPKIIVWCSDPRNVPLFLDDRFNITDVCSTEWAWRVICQATQVSHVSNIYRRLMSTTEDTNEFYELQLPSDWRPTSFRSVQNLFYEYNQNRAESRSVRDSKKNTIMLLGFSKTADLRKESLEINPDPEAMVAAGDFLLFLTYKFTARTKTGVLNFLMDK